MAELNHATAFLKRLPVFAEVDDEGLLQTLAKHFNRTTHRKGDVLAKEGEPQPGTDAERFPVYSFVCLRAGTLCSDVPDRERQGEAAEERNGRGRAWRG